MVINPYVIDEQGKISDIFSKNLEQNVIYLVGEINDEQAAVITAQMLHLANVGKGDIQLYINSPGGSVAAGLSIYDTMQHIHNDVATICLGQAASMAAVLLSGGTKGKRYILPHGEVMIHQPSGGMEGQAADMCIAAEHIKRIRAELNHLLSSNCGKDYEQMCIDTERDYWLNAEEAVGYGVVDKMLEPKEAVI
jgi:ATP-dependent Clp protease protease subunit